MQLTGWQIVMVLAIAAGTAITGAVIGGAAATALIAFASTIVGIIGGILTNVRSPAARTRASDRNRTSPLGVPLEQTPSPVTVQTGTGIPTLKQP